MARCAAVEGRTLPTPPVPALNPIHSTHNPSLPTHADPPPSPTELSRSASYSHLPTAEEVQPARIERTLSANILPLSTSSEKTRGMDGGVDGSVHSANVELFRRASKKAKRKMNS